MIEVSRLTKCYGDQTVVDDLSFVVRPGIVTGFLGPNGAGKSTTMRMILGLDRPSAGRATVDGQAYVQHRAPLRRIGALLDAKGVHPGRPARDTCGCWPPRPASRMPGWITCSGSWA